MNYINTFFDSITHLFYPHICCGCGSDVIQNEQVLCIECLDQLPLTNFHMHASNPVARVFAGRLPLISASSFVYFTKGSVMQRLMHAFKYRGKKNIGTYFGRRMGECYKSCGSLEHVDCLIPLPLHPAKQKVRGYNQAQVICEGMSQILDIPVLTTVIKRSTRTSTQTRMNRMERWENMEGKFVIHDRHALEQKHVLLVDDVITTGATLESCGTTLLQGGGASLSIVSLAYTSL